MRDIMFRGKRPNGKWKISKNIEQRLDSRIILGGYLVIPETVGQYWRTVNEIDIYDGDIFTINGKYPKVVKYDEAHACFCIGNIEQIQFQDTFDIWQTPDSKWWEERALMIEIIGNIHDNPELLTNT